MAHAAGLHAALDHPDVARFLPAPDVTTLDALRARIERLAADPSPAPAGERSETGGGDPDGSAGGAGGRAPRGIDFLAVTHSDEAPSRRWCESFGGAGGVQLITDPDRARYAAWGVGLSDRRHFAGPESLGALRRL
ncbi:MAG TPA: hypothetical protein VF516_19420, partial [Kofleriaceae bacterium]